LNRGRWENVNVLGIGPMFISKGLRGPWPAGGSGEGEDVGVKRGGIVPSWRLDQLRRKSTIHALAGAMRYRGFCIQKCKGNTTQREQ